MGATRAVQGKVEMRAFLFLYFCTATSDRVNLLSAFRNSALLNKLLVRPVVARFL